MQESGFTPNIQPLKEFEDDYGLKPEDGEESDDDDDDDDEDFETDSDEDDDEEEGNASEEE